MAAVASATPEPEAKPYGYGGYGGRGGYGGGYGGYRGGYGGRRYGRSVAEEPLATEDSALDASAMPKSLEKRSAEPYGYGGYGGRGGYGGGYGGYRGGYGGRRYGRSVAEEPLATEDSALDASAMPKSLEKRSAEPYGYGGYGGRGGYGGGYGGYRGGYGGRRYGRSVAEEPLATEDSALDASAMPKSLEKRSAEPYGYGGYGGRGGYGGGYGGYRGGYGSRRYGRSVAEEPLATEDSALDASAMPKSLEKRSAEPYGYGGYGGRGGYILHSHRVQQISFQVIWAWQKHQELSLQ